jgi:outer membrane protein TolC
MGAGEVIQSRIRQTQANEATLNLTDVQARVAEDVTSAAQSAQADQSSLESAEQAVVQALETWRRLSEASFGLAGAEHQYDPLQPLIALRDLADARTLYLGAVIDFNKSQFRLYWAMGQPPIGALRQMVPRPTSTPVVPEPYSRPEEVPPPAKR